MKKVFLHIPKLLSTAVLCLTLCLSPCASSLVYADYSSVDWDWDDDHLVTFSTEDDTKPQLVGFSYFTEKDTNMLVGSPKNGFYDLHLAIGVVGEESAENVQIKFSTEQPDNDGYRDEIDFYAEIGADNYETITVSRGAFISDGENCGFSLNGPIKLLSDRADPSNGVKLTEDLETPIVLSSAGVNSIDPGADSLREIVVPVMFYSDPPTFTEANQPPQTRFNAISDNPTIGDEATNSAWVTDEQGNLVSFLTAGHTYTQHYYVRVSGPNPAANTTLKSKVFDGQKIASGNSWGLSATVKADGVRSFSYEASYSAQDNIQLRYVEGSLTLHRQNQEDIALNPSLFFPSNYYSSDGAKIGTNSLDGVIAPGTDSACEITYQFTTTDYVAEEEAARAAKEQERQQKEEAKKAAEAEKANALTFEDSSAWITSEGGNKVRALGADKTYTVHAKIVVSGKEQGEGVRIACSDINSLVLDENSQAIYFRLTSDNVENSTMSIGIDRPYRDSSEVIYLKLVKGSVKVRTATGTYALPDSSFFDYENGCLVGFSGADGLIPVGKDHSAEITFQVETSTKDSKSIASFGNLSQKPIFSITILIIAIIELVCIVYMACRPDNRLARFIIRCRKAAGSIRAGFKTARADLRSDKKTTSAEQTKGEVGETSKEDSEA